MARDPAARVDYAVAWIELGHLDAARAELERVPADSAFAYVARWELVSRPRS